MSFLKEQKIYNEAHEAGMVAGKRFTPEPMTVSYRDIDGSVRRDTISDGVCGFAYVRIRPARGKFVKFLKDNRIGYTSYEGGYKVSVNAFNQSMERKLAYAVAFCKVLDSYNINAYPESRLD